MATAYQGPSRSARNLSWAARTASGGDPFAAMRTKRSGDTHDNGWCWTSMRAASAADATRMSVTEQKKRVTVGVLAIFPSP